MSRSGGGILARGTTDPIRTFAGAERNTTVVAIAGGVRFNWTDEDGLIVPWTCGEDATQSASVQLMEAVTAIAAPALA